MLFSNHFLLHKSFHFNLQNRNEYLQICLATSSDFHKVFTLNSDYASGPTSNSRLASQIMSLDVDGTWNKLK